MAEFCLDCFNKYITDNGKTLKEKDVILIDDWCEGCQQHKPCVAVIRPRTFRERIKKTFLNFKLLK